MPTADIVNVSDSLTLVKTVRERDKIRIISETVSISESIALYKNGELVVPITPVEVPTPQNIIGFRQRAVRIPKRAPRAILIEAELTNLVIAPIKLLAFSDGINKAIAAIRPRVVQNVALSATRVSLARSHLMVARSQIKIQSQPMQVKAQLALLSPPSMWARSKLKTRPETQSIHALKAVNFEKMHKLTRIMKIAMLANM